MTREKLLALCRERVDGQLRAAEEAIRMAQESANEETKSSAGDKYETGRAMAQLEIEKSMGQLAEAGKLRKALEQIAEPVNSEVVRWGSLVITDQGKYFISIAAGKLELDGETWFAISPASPLGAVLLGAGPGATVTFLKRMIRVESLG